MHKRLRTVCFLLLFSVTALSLQLYSITQNSTILAFSQKQSHKSVTLYTTRGEIYDRNLHSLITDSTLAAVYPTDKGLNVTTDLRGLPGGAAFFSIPTRDYTLAPHILGYLSDGVGISGIEAAYDTLLCADRQTASASIQQNGVGKPTSSITLSLPEPHTAGVVLTLDAAIQQIAMQAGSSIKKGAIVCMDADTAEILALCSFPTFDNPADALSNPDSPLYNRALSAYPVGSVFKPIIAAAVLDAGYSPDMGFLCTGTVEIDGLAFRCHNRNGHGLRNLRSAMVDSCNPYFISLSTLFSAEIFLSTATAFGFGTPTNLAPGIKGSAGKLPSLPMTRTAAANFSFGQGDLSATPLQICAMYAAIANGGTYHAPSLVLGTTADGIKITARPKNLSEQAAKQNTIRILQDILYDTANSETSQAKSDLVKIHGKTGTAQTGQYQNGVEKLVGWYAGWFSAGKRTIAAAIVVEDADSGNADAAPIMKALAEAIAASD